MVKAIIFDCFGVLYPAYADIYVAKHQEQLADQSKLLDDLYTQVDMSTLSQTGFYQAVASLVNVPAEDVKLEMEAMLVADQRLVTIIKNLKNSYKIGLLSNAGEEEISIIHRDGVANLFDAAAVSYEVGDVKPNPKIYHTCLERLGITPAESIYFDDCITNVQAARELGMKAVHYPTFGNPPKELLDLVQT